MSYYDHDEALSKRSTAEEKNEHNAADRELGSNPSKKALTQSLGSDAQQDKCKWEETETDPKVHGKCFWAPKGCNCPGHAPKACNTREKGSIIGFRQTMNVCCERDDNGWCEKNPAFTWW